MPNIDPPNNCRQTEVVYEGAIKLQEDNAANGAYKKTYKGCTKGEIKKRIAIHRNTFNDANKRTNTEMAKEVHNLKDANKNFITTWKILE